MKHSLFLSILILLSSAAFCQQSADTVMIRLIAPLDEPKFYCVDIPGYGEGIRLNDPLATHSLKKFGAEDVTFVINYPEEGQIYNVKYDLCFEAEKAKSGTSLYLKKPSDSPLQRFEFTEDGTIVLQSKPKLGFVVGPNPGVDIGDGKNLRRDLFIQKLKKADDQYKIWKIIRGEKEWP